MVGQYAKATQRWVLCHHTSSSNFDPTYLWSHLTLWSPLPDTVSVTNNRNCHIFTGSHPLPEILPSLSTLPAYIPYMESLEHYFDDHPLWEASLLEFIQHLNTRTSARTFTANSLYVVNDAVHTPLGPALFAFFIATSKLYLWRPLVRKQDKPAMLSLRTQPTQYALWSHGQIICPQLHWQSILYFLSFKTSPSSQRFLTISTSQPTCAFPTEVQVEEQWQKVHWLVSSLLQALCCFSPQIDAICWLIHWWFSANHHLHLFDPDYFKHGARARTISQPLTIYHMSTFHQYPSLKKGLRIFSRSLPTNPFQSWPPFHSAQCCPGHI